RRAPVYAARKNPTRHPTTANTRANTPFSMKRPSHRLGHVTAINDTNEQRPNSARATDPTDIGDQYFISGAWNMSPQARTENGQPRWNASFTNSDRTSMCQNRSGRFRSMIKNRPHRHTNGNAIV